MKTVRTATQLLTMFSADQPNVTVSAAAARFGLTMSATSRLLAAMASSGHNSIGKERNVKTVRTATQLLTMFSADQPNVTVSAAAARFGLTMSATSRLLAAMASSGLIQRNPDRSYRPGPLAYRLGLLYHSQNRLADLVNQGARKIVDDTGLTCWVSVLAGKESMLISRFPGPRDQGFHVDVGNLLPSQASAGGKALLSRLPEADARALLKSMSLTGWTAKSKTNVTELLADIAGARARGWSIIVDELFVGVTSVGVALSAPTEATAMALSVSLPQPLQSTDHVRDAVRSLMLTACEIGEMIGDHYWQEKRQSANDDAGITREILAYMGAGPSAGS